MGGHDLRWPVWGCKHCDFTMPYTGGDTPENDYIDSLDDLTAWRAWAFAKVGARRRCSDLRDAIDSTNDNLRQALETERSRWLAWSMTLYGVSVHRSACSCPACA